MTFGRIPIGAPERSARQSGRRGFSCRREANRTTRTCAV